jgi:photosystem II stability/assembly factor-like uncharacterized protein
MVGIVAFVVVDVLLVAMAVRNVRDRPAPIGASSSSPQGAAGRGSDADGAAAADGAPAETVLLDAAVGGALLRATRGDCGGPQPRVGISTDGGRSFRSVESPAGEVLRVEIDSVADVWLVGLDQACAPTFYRSSDAGESWEESPGTAGAWHLLPADAQALHAPDGEVAIGCRPQTLTAVDSEVAYAGCADDTLRLTRDGGSTWRPAGRVPGLVATAFRGPVAGVAVGATPRCPARLWSTTNAGSAWAADQCLPGDEPVQAVAVSAGVTYVQRGGQVVADRDGLGFANP